MENGTSFLYLRFIFNYIGAPVRWLFGNKSDFSFSDYLNGPKNSNDNFDEIAHKFNNRIIGFITLSIIVGILIKIV
jgi:hypothetical protein